MPSTAETCSEVTGQIGLYDFVFGPHQLPLCWWCNETTLCFGYCGDCDLEYRVDFLFLAEDIWLFKLG